MIPSSSNIIQVALNLKADLIIDEAIYPWSEQNCPLQTVIIVRWLAAWCKGKHLIILTMLILSDILWLQRCVSLVLSYVLRKCHVWSAGGGRLPQLYSGEFLRPSQYHSFFGDILHPGPRLNIKTVLSTYGDFHVKDKTAVRTSYL